MYIFSYNCLKYDICSTASAASVARFGDSSDLCNDPKDFSFRSSFRSACLCHCNAQSQNTRNPIKKNFHKTRIEMACYGAYYTFVTKCRNLSSTTATTTTTSRIKRLHNTHTSSWNHLRKGSFVTSSDAPARKYRKPSIDLRAARTRVDQRGSTS